MKTSITSSYLYINPSEWSHCKACFQTANPSSAFPDFIRVYKILHIFHHSNLFFSLEYSFSQILVYCKFWIPCCVKIPRQNIQQRPMYVFSCTSVLEDLLYLNCKFQNKCVWFCPGLCICKRVKSTFFLPTSTEPEPKHGEKLPHLEALVLFINTTYSEFQIIF